MKQINYWIKSIGWKGAKLFPLELAISRGYETVYEFASTHEHRKSRIPTFHTRNFERTYDNGAQDNKVNIDSQQYVLLTTLLKATFCAQCGISKMF